MSFERFKCLRRSQSCTATTSNRGIITLNKESCLQYELNEQTAKYVQLYYDEECNTIGMIFTDKKDEYVSKVRFMKYGLSFSAVKLFKFYDILPHKSISHRIYKDTNGMIIIDANMKKQTNE